MLSHGRVTREIVRFSSGRDPSNWISLVLIEVSFHVLDLRLRMFTLG